jgi:hypothetical protein
MPRLVSEDGASGWEVWLDQLGDLVKELIALPLQTGRVMTMLERGQVRVDLSKVSRQIYHLEGAVNRILGGFVFVTFLLAGPCCTAMAK